MVIGGGHNLSSRTQRSGRGAPPQPSGGQGQGLHHSRSEPQFNPEPAAEVSSVATLYTTCQSGLGYPLCSTRFAPICDGAQLLYSDAHTC